MRKWPGILKFNGMKIIRVRVTFTYQPSILDLPTFLGTTTHETSITLMLRWVFLQAICIKRHIVSGTKANLTTVDSLDDGVAVCLPSINVQVLAWLLPCNQFKTVGYNIMYMPSKCYSDPDYYNFIIRHKLCESRLEKLQTMAFFKGDFSDTTIREVKNTVLHR